MRVSTTSSKSKTYRILGKEILASAPKGKQSTRQISSMIDTARRQIVRDAWRLAKPYWTSEEKWSALGASVRRNRVQPGQRPHQRAHQRMEQRLLRFEGLKAYIGVTDD